MTQEAAGAWIQIYQIKYSRDIETNVQRTVTRECSSKRYTELDAGVALIRECHTLHVF